MGADAFLAFYGIKFPLDPDDEDGFDACGNGTDPRCVAAARVGLQTHNGNMTDGEDYFLYVGQRLGVLGLEHDSYVRVRPEQLTQAMSQIDKKLVEAGFRETAVLHLQLEAQY